MKILCTLLFVMLSLPLLAQKGNWETKNSLVLYELKPEQAYAFVLKKPVQLNLAPYLKSGPDRLYFEVLPTSDALWAIADFRKLKISQMEKQKGEKLQVKDLGLPDDPVHNLYLWRVQVPFQSAQPGGRIMLYEYFLDLRYGNRLFRLGIATDQLNDREAEKILLSYFKQLEFFDKGLTKEALLKRYPKQTF